LGSIGSSSTSWIVDMSGVFKSYLTTGNTEAIDHSEAIQTLMRKSLHNSSTGFKNSYKAIEKYFAISMEKVTAWFLEASTFLSTYMSMFVPMLLVGVVLLRSSSDRSLKGLQFDARVLQKYYHAKSKKVHLADVSESVPPSVLLAYCVATRDGQHCEDPYNVGSCDRNVVAQCEKDIAQKHTNFTRPRRSARLGTTNTRSSKKQNVKKLPAAAANSVKKRSRRRWKSAKRAVRAVRQWRSSTKKR
jgi:hypothetical protein